MAKITVIGMSCQHCVASVTEALSKIDGIENVEVDIASGTASFDETKEVSGETIRKALEEIGFGLAE